MSIKKIQELLKDILRKDVSPQGLDYAFPETQRVIYYDSNEDILIEYGRLNKDYFRIINYDNPRVTKDSAEENDDLVSNSDMLLTIKQAIEDKIDPHEISIEKSKGGYTIHVYEIIEDAVSLDHIIDSVVEGKVKVIIFKDEYNSNFELVAKRIPSDGSFSFHKNQDYDREALGIDKQNLKMDEMIRFLRRNPDFKYYLENNDEYLIVILDDVI